MPLTVLSVGYPLAKVSDNTAGGAEHVLSMLDAALVREGHHSLVLAPAGSRSDRFQTLAIDRNVITKVITSGAIYGFLIARESPVAGHPRTSS